MCRSAPSAENYAGQRTPCGSRDGSRLALLLPPHVHLPQPQWSGSGALPGELWAWCQLAHPYPRWWSGTLHLSTHACPRLQVSCCCCCPSDHHRHCLGVVMNSLISWMTKSRVTLWILWDLLVLVFGQTVMAAYSVQVSGLWMPLGPTCLSFRMECHGGVFCLALSDLPGSGKGKKEKEEEGYSHLFFCLLLFLLLSRTSFLFLSAFPIPPTHPTHRHIL